MVINPISLGSGSGGLTPTIQVTSRLEPSVTKNGVSYPYKRELNPAYRGLPSGYTQVTSLTFGSNKYISFDPVDFTQDFEVEIVATPSNTTNTWIPVLINRYTGGFWFGFNNGSCVVRLFNGSNYISVTPPPINVTTTFTIKKVGVTTSLYFDGVLKGSANNIPYVNTTGSEQTSLGTDGTANAFNGSITSAKFGGYDFVPCYNSNNEYGMYDMVSHQFFGNSGTGAFTGGEEVPEYLAYTFENLPLGEYEVSNGLQTQYVTLLRTKREKVAL